MLKEGSRGEAVKTLQKALNDLGYGLKADGHYGAQTKAAVIKFQKQHSELKADGIFGAKTRVLILKRFCMIKNFAVQPSLIEMGLF